MFHIRRCHLQLTEIVCERLNSKEFDFITVNFANADMLGHTGDLQRRLRQFNLLIHTVLVKFIKKLKKETEL